MHHLRSDEEWEMVFSKIYKSLKKGGCFWISDLIKHDHPAIDQLMWKRYSDYLEGVGAKPTKKMYLLISPKKIPRDQYSIN